MSTLLLPLLLVAGAAPPAAQVRPAVALAAAEFRKIDRDSGKDNYYRVVSEGGESWVAADYRPGMESETFGAKLPEALRKKATLLRWRWRVRAFPPGGDDCVPGKGDSAAGVFLTFHSGLKWIILKYIWSETRPKGTVCDRRNGPFLRRDTTVLESGAGAGEWRAEAVDPKGEYAQHFGVKREDVPELVGVGLFTDGDQTKSGSSADYGGFQLETDVR